MGARWLIDKLPCIEVYFLLTNSDWQMVCVAVQDVASYILGSALSKAPESEECGESPPAP